LPEKTFRSVTSIPTKQGQVPVMDKDGFQEVRRPKGKPYVSSGTLSNSKQSLNKGEILGKTTEYAYSANDLEEDKQIKNTCKDSPAVLEEVLPVDHLNSALVGELLSDAPPVPNST
jgi:hypothetical protein